MPGFRVLLVDDETIFTKNMSKLLKNRGYTVTSANSGDAAIRELEQNPVDVIVLDLKMPGMDGMEVLRRVGRHHPEVAVVMLTGHGSEKDRDEALRLHAFAYLQKPVQIDQLVRLIKERCGQ
jgi:CheY-like chemotaxis protein